MRILTITGLLLAFAPAAFAADLVVRPGTFVDGGCTLGFAFAADGERFMSTAGHCIEDNVGREDVWQGFAGPSVAAGGHPIGAAAYAIWNQDALQPEPVDQREGLPPADFALIRLLPTTRWSPRVCHFGGPTGIEDPVPGSPPMTVHYYGNGEPAGREQITNSRTLPARSGLVSDFSNPWWVPMLGVVGGGDSGMPVLDRRGHALGLLSHLGSPVGSNAIPVSRLAPHLARASKALHMRLSLQRAALTASAAPFGSDGCS